MRAATLIVICLIAADFPAAHASPASDERSLMSSVNNERARRGIASLGSSGELASVARRHSARMAASGRVYHNNSLGRQTSGWTYVGENVGAGSSAAAVHRALIRDAAHREIILDPNYSHAGVGVAYRGNTLYVTEVFALRHRVPVKPQVSRARRVRRPSPAAAPRPAPVVKPLPPPPAPPVRSVSLILRLLAMDEPTDQSQPRFRSRDLDLGLLRPA
jgi:cysteine-rich secretory family protein